ncbi:MAG: RNase adapter RapZ [Agathobacter sp.]|nr:RNase adapter RapZ [Agathobacter sp.]
MRFVIVTGMSGAGRNTAMKMMEDIGFYCIDNLPIQLLDKLVELSSSFHSDITDVAVGIDARNAEDLSDVPRTLELLKQKNIEYKILYLDADDDVLVKRYKETRRNHPLAAGERIEAGIQLEKTKLTCIKAQADYIIDTSRLLTRELKEEINKIFVEDENYQNLFVTILSFGFKYGIPSDSDIVMDVRFLPNPYYDLNLRPKTGNDKEIQEFVMKHKESQEFIDKLEDMITFLIPNYIAEGKNQLVISIGCTGGKHRSVTLANELYKRLDTQTGFGLKIEHRDITKDSLRGK